MSEMPTFVYVLKPHHSSLIEEMSPAEELVASQHFEYLQRALGERRLVLAGPCLDGEFGIVVFRARTQEAALEFMSNDPAVKGELMTARLHAFRISLMEKD